MSMLKFADLTAAITGAIRASNLTEAQRAKLKKDYGLRHDASLGWRNAGRGVLGGQAGAWGGALGGAAIGAGVGTLAGLIAKNPSLGARIGAAGGGLSGSFAGWGYGVKRSTDKYSRSNPILRKNSK